MSNRKEEILIVALHLFARDGYEAVSVSQIAGELDMTMQSWKAVMNIYLAQTKVLSEAYGKATISLFIRRM